MTPAPATSKAIGSATVRVTDAETAARDERRKQRQDRVAHGVALVILGCVAVVAVAATVAVVRGLL